MKVGLGFYPSIFNDDTLAFAKQIGVSHIMVHIPDATILPNDKMGYWTLEDLTALVRRVESHKLKLEAIENFQPAHWHEVLLGYPSRQKQMDNLKRTIENMGRAGIPVMGYNFSIAGVSGRKQLPLARGGAVTPVYRQEDIADFDTPVPHGYAWSTQVVKDPPPGNQGFVDEETMWERLDYFLDQILPVAEEYGVQMAAHPEDPPVPVMRQVSRLLINIERYERMFARHKSDKCMVEFCQGTFSEMPYGSEYVYEAIDNFTKKNKISYVHFRNVRGQLPNYYEEFIDTGDVDMIRALKIYQKNGYSGMLIPDHVPAMAVKEPWVSGVAYAIGYMRALMKALDIPIAD